MRLQNKKALITGGGSGIGRATALAMAAEGADVAVVDINLAAAQAVATEVAALGVKALGIAGDVADEASVQAAVAEAAGAFGTINVLFNNAGIIRRANVIDTTTAEWDQVMGVNVRGVFLMCKSVVPLMIATAAAPSLTPARAGASRAAATLCPTAPPRLP